MFDLFTPHALTFKHFTIAAFGNIVEMVSDIMNKAASTGQQMQGACRQIPVPERNPDVPAEQCFVQES